MPAMAALSRYCLVASSVVATTSAAFALFPTLLKSIDSITEALRRLLKSSSDEYVFMSSPNAGIEMSGRFKRLPIRARE